MGNKIKAPSKISWGLRFKNRCTLCGRIIPETQVFCIKCGKKKILK